MEYTVNTVFGGFLQQDCSQKHSSLQKATSSQPCHGALTSCKDIFDNNTKDSWILEHIEVVGAQPKELVINTFLG